MPVAEEKYFDLKIISPNRIFYQGKASMVELNTLEGRIGIYRRHLPVTTVLEPGIAVDTEEGGRVAGGYRPEPGRRGQNPCRAQTSDKGSEHQRSAGRDCPAKGPDQTGVVRSREEIKSKTDTETAKMAVPVSVFLLYWR